MKHKRKKFATIVLCFILMINAMPASVQGSTTKKESDPGKDKQTQAYWPEGPQVSAGAAVVMDVKTGLVLYEKNGTKKNYPASITKVLTSLVALENASLSDEITFSKDAVFKVERGSSSCGIDWGEILPLEDCLYGMMLQSGNEVAYAIAENVGGTYEHFIQMMNDKAKELGCVNSHFANPHGLSDEDHYTCAYDMALIGRTAIQNTTFAQITGSRTYVAAPTNKQEETRPWANKHKFVAYKNKYEGCIGGKTGYTLMAKHTLITFAKRGDMTLVCVIMDEPSGTEQYTETADLLDYGFDQFRISKISELDRSRILEDSYFFDQYSSILSADKPLLKLGDDSYVILPSGVDLSAVDKKIDYYEKEENTNSDAQEAKEESTENGTEIGKVTFTYCDKVIGIGSILLVQEKGELPVTIHSLLDPSEDTAKLANTDATNVKENEKNKRNLKPIIVTILIGSVVIILLLYYFTVERQRLKRRKAYLERRRNHSRF